MRPAKVIFDSKRAWGGQGYFLSAAVAVARHLDDFSPDWRRTLPIDGRV